MPGLGPPGSARPGPAAEGARAGRGLLRSGLAVGAGRAEARGRRVRRGLSASEGGEEPPRAPGGLGGRGLARAERGRGEPGGGGGATAAPPEAKFEKRTRFPPFFKPKNKTFAPISLTPLSSSGPSPLPAPQGVPRSAKASRCGGGVGFAFPPRRGGGARGPCPESGPSVWAGCGSSRQPGRATVGHSAMLADARLPPPRKSACGFGSPLPASLWLVLLPPRRGSACTGGSRACGRRGLF